MLCYCDAQLFDHTMNREAGWMGLSYFLFFVVDQIKREQKALLRAAKQLNAMDDRLIHKSTGVVQGLMEKEVEGGGDYGTSTVGS